MNYINRLKTIETELKAVDSAVVAKEDMEALAMMVEDGYTTPHIEEILKDNTIKNRIRTDKIVDVTFSSEDKKVISECIANKGKVPGLANDVKEDSGQKNYFVSAKFNPDEISGVVLMNNYIVAIIRKGIDKPLYLYFESEKDAKFAYENIIKDF